MYGTEDSVPNRVARDARRTRARIMKSRTYTLLLLLLSGFALAGPLAAQDPPRDGKPLHVNPVASNAISRLRSPFCPGEMLAVCTSTGGAMLRDSIQAMAVAGMSADSIVNLVVRAYGPDVRAEPLTKGMGLWAWVIPPVGLAAGLALVALLLARRRRRTSVLPEEDVPEPSVDPEDAERIREAMKEMDEAEEPAF